MKFGEQKSLIKINSGMNNTLIQLDKFKKSKKFLMKLIQKLKFIKIERTIQNFYERKVSI